MTMPSTPSGKSRDEIAAAYRSPPWWYDLRGFFILTFSYRSSLGRAVRFFGANMGAKHLELACGTGTLLELAWRWRRWRGLPDVQITGVDYAESMLAGALRRFRRHPEFRFIHGDAACLPFDPASFETINIANSVHCFPDVDRALCEAFRVLKPGGTLAANALLFPRGRWPLRDIAGRINRWGIRKGILVTPFRQEAIRACFVSAGFTVVSEVVSGNCLYLIAAKSP